MSSKLYTEEFKIEAVKQVIRAREQLFLMLETLSL
jgi:hypothetical protein